jgi:phosphoenolpyruvate carboxykinase (GTP)
MKAQLLSLYDGCMRGRTLYVLPFGMGQSGPAVESVSNHRSAYVAVSMHIMTRMGGAAVGC